MLYNSHPRAGGSRGTHIGRDDTDKKPQFLPRISDWYLSMELIDTLCGVIQYPILFFFYSNRKIVARRLEPLLR
jgi:hypothetical protein